MKKIINKIKNIFNDKDKMFKTIIVFIKYAIIITFTSLITHTLLNKEINKNIEKNIQIEQNLLNQINELILKSNTKKNDKKL